MNQPEIIYEDNDIIVCQKPAGLAVQTSKIREQDLENLLKNHLAQIPPKSGNPYLAVIHRLDQNVEGLLVFAKTPLAAKELNRQMQAGGFTKEYIALLSRRPEKEDGILTDYLVKDGKTNTSKVVNEKTAGAKKAVLSYHLVTGNELESLACIAGEQHIEAKAPADTVPVRVKLETGRHHQIRVQMAHCGYALVGDLKYGGLSGVTPSIALCAFHLGFKHPVTNKTLEYYIVPPFLKY